MTQSPLGKHLSYLARKQRGYYKRLCPDCGEPMSYTARHCNKCWVLHRHRDMYCRECGSPISKSKYDYCRSCAQRLRFVTNGKPPLPPNPYCPNRLPDRGICQAMYPHRHCECGLPMAVDAHACALCIKEQPRIEFKIWPTEAA